MAKIVNSNDKDSKFPNSILGKSPFLTSVRDFCPDGIKLGIESVSKVFPNPQEPKKAQMAIELVVMGDMEKCRCYVLDDDGEYITIKDELTGKEARKLELKSISSDDLVMFPMFMPCGKPSEIDNESDLTFYPSSSAYPLFKKALQNAGELPEDMGNKPFITNQVELKNALEGYTFVGGCEYIRGKYNYERLIVLRE